MLKSIMDRRSVRKYTSEPVTEEQLHTLLECAMLAPSAKDVRSWRFVVVDDREILNELSENHPYARMLKQAPMCICVCGVDNPEVPGYYQQDCAAATMNILIAAKEMGLGTCWMGVSPRPERMETVRRILGIPEDIMPFNMIAVGHPAEERSRPDRWDETMIHRNRW